VSGQEIERYDPQLPADLSGAEYADLVDLGRQFHHHLSLFRWALGDIAAHVEISYGEGRLQQYASDLGIEYETLRVYRWVSQQYPQSVRRVTLSWSVHRVLAAEEDRLDLIQSNYTVAGAKEGVARRREAEQDALPAPAPSPSPSTRSPTTRQPSAKDRKITQQAATIARYENTIAGLRGALDVAGERNMQAVTATMHDHVCTFRATRTCAGCGAVEDADEASEAGLVTRLENRVAELEAQKASVQQWAVNYQARNGGSFKDIELRLAAQELALKNPAI
jgi:hypothetical protein